MKRMMEEEQEQIAVEIARQEGLVWWKLAEGKQQVYKQRAYQIYKVIQKLGYVRLAEDQSLPENPIKLLTETRDDKGVLLSSTITTANTHEAILYSEAQQDMLNNNFRKIEKGDL